MLEWSAVTELVSAVEVLSNRCSSGEEETIAGAGEVVLAGVACGDVCGEPLLL